jgi:lipid II:glycine glycyltransferase (peptidoglycan interpeptide bridge formation enzyme)
MNSIGVCRLICEADGVPINGVVFSAIGDRAIYLFGATGTAGGQLNGSYLLQWRIIEWLKERGVRYYDLGGCNPSVNPGVYNFKRGIAGKNGWEETFVGEFEGWFDVRGRVGKLLCDAARSSRRIARVLRLHR